LDELPGTGAHKLNWSEQVQALRQDLKGVWEHLNGNPEVSWTEHRTTQFLAARLDQLGLRVKTFGEKPGVVGEWGPESGPVVALRADMDALWQEVHGVWQGNHSCGHDAHMTTVLGAITLLKKAFPTPSVRYRVLFQPAEEVGEGAAYLVEQGAVEDVVYLFGLHLRPIQELRNGQMSAAIYNGAATSLKGVIQGVEAHGARPHLGVNAIEVAFSAMQAVSTIHLNPMVPYTVKMTQISAGGQNTNTIPGKAAFSFDLRAQTNETMDALIEQTESRMKAVCALYEAELTLDWGARTMAAEVGLGAREILAQAIKDCFGEEVLAADVTTPGAEDFHFYTALRPELQATMLGLGCDLAPGLHHPYMTFTQEALFDGMVVLADAVVKADQTLGNV